jgi:hypothetical protein
MNQEVDEKITAIKAFLQTAGLKVAHKQNVLRTRLKNGYLVDVFTLKNTPDRIRARIKTEEQDPSKRQAQVTSTHLAFSEVLAGIVRVAPFCLSRESGGAHIFLADLSFEAEDDDDAPIEIGEDDIAIIETKDVVEDSESDSTGADSLISLQETGEPDKETEADDLADFALDFDSGPENRIKVAKSLAEEALENLQTVDSKTLRQRLDIMALRRTSGVRLAITRIFRSALEVADLEKTVRKEAKRIVSQEDRSELQAIKSICGDGVLDPVINLLWQEVFK